MTHPTEAGDLVAAVGDVIRRHTPPESASAVTPDADLAQLGLDSLALAGLIADLEATFAVEFPEYLLDAATFRTVASTAAAIAGIGG